MKIPQRNSIVSSATESLREAIRLGEFSKHLPGVRKLSNDLHVSIPTILKAIHALEKEGIVRSEPGRRTSILSPAKRTKGGKLAAQKVVFLTFSKNWTVAGEYYQIVINELKELGISVRIHECESKNRTMLPGNLHEVISQPADCWVLLGAPPAVQTFFANSQLACLLDGIAVEGLALPDFDVDLEALFRHSINYLLNRGHRRICLINAEHTARLNPKSMEVARDALRKGAPDLSAWDPIRTYDGSTEQFKNLLHSLFFRKNLAPTALIISMGKRVATAMMWLMSHGLRIPEDVSIISRDCDEFLECVHPLPAHYRQPPSAAKRFVRAILAVINKRHSRRHTRIMTVFYPGDTVSSIGVEPSSLENSKSKSIKKLA